MKSGKGNKMEGLSALYGMAQTIPDQSLSQEIGIRYLDVLYETESWNSIGLNILQLNWKSTGSLIEYQSI